ncbi:MULTISPECIES: hypothetical protein [unclassified Acidovorax]|uniref:hypothetical protein n=1 Tax=unclassified Acidovorax TaxID=2684926 RepID=UPI002882FE78|nr:MULTISPECIES: hypothetical protein [unclassified Acidovorax]
MSASPPSTQASSVPNNTLVEQVPTIKTDGWGSLGPVLTEYHFGDLLGILGLIISVLTFFQAKSARKAATSAAATAIKARNDLETASLLSELVGILRTIRDLYHADNVALLDLLKDRAVDISVNTKATLSDDENAVELMSNIEKHLRQNTKIHKDEVKRKAQFQRAANMIIKLADNVELLKSKRLKNGI